MAFLLELGRHGAAVSGDPREIAHLFHWLSIYAQHFNAVVFKGTFKRGTRVANSVLARRAVI